LGGVNVFEEVTRGPRGVSGGSLLRIEIGRQNDHLGSEAPIPETLKRSKSLAVGALGLQQYDLGPQLHGLLQACPPAACAADDLQVGPGVEARLKGLADIFVIVNDQQSRRTHCIQSMLVLDCFTV
jgi:hypothetical protein